MQKNDTAVRITDEAVTRLRERIGAVRRTREEPTLEEATKDAIRIWARAIGDLNPLWTDEEYSSATRYGGIIAQPSMLYGFSLQAIGDRSGLPGVHSFFAGADHEWYLPVRRNDSISVTMSLSDVVELRRRSGGRMIKQVSEVEFVNQHQEVVARTWPWGLRMERQRSSTNGSTSTLTPATYPPEEIERISDQYAQEPTLIRGSTPRYWEDVRVGDTIGPLIRGPWTATTSIGFLRAYGGQFLKSHGYWFDFLRRHPRAGVLNGQGIPEGPSRGHWDSEFARSIGVPAAYDLGPERIGWFCTLATYWCGDDGWLQRLRVEVRRFNLEGDLTTLSGVVTAKGIDDGTHTVECDLRAVDQRGEATATATATIALPSATTGKDEDLSMEREGVIRRAD
ncbi:FAS1-like dehydratase domain-containing protein [Actinophytocola sp.]|uniref:FAS1-like dehydratase domain-containing protein n=1 Tax=Actinophytocola sp. TaxID=1872138 RepID=UPI003D6AD0B7